MPSASDQTPHASNPKWNLSGEDQEDIAAINASIDRMRAFTPTHPYVLTIPQEEPRYHHSYQYQADQWQHNTPFNLDLKANIKDKEHENLQYQTFIYHEPGAGLYMLHNSGPSEGNANDREGRRTGASTPSGQPKKTISLSAYKKKQTGATPDHASVKDRDQVAKKAAIKGPVERVKADEEIIAAVEEDKAKDVNTPIPPKKEEKKDLKRKRGDSVTEQARPTEKSIEKEHAGSEEPTKRAQKTSSPPSSTEPAQHASKPSNNEHSHPGPTFHSEEEQVPQEPTSSTLQPPAEPALPSKLSPPFATAEETEMPPKLAAVVVAPLPSRLSPTIPESISTAVDVRKHGRSLSRSSQMPGSRSASKDAASRHLTPPHKAVPRNGFRANSSSPAVRSDAEERVCPVTSAPSRPRTPENQAKSRRSDIDEVKVARSEQRNDSAAEKKSMIVKLKIKKSQREAVKRILKMRSDPVKIPASKHNMDEDDAQEGRDSTRTSHTLDARQRARRDTNAKGVAQKIGPASAANNLTKRDWNNTTPTEKKRPRAEDDVDSDGDRVKRKKIDANTSAEEKREPSTPDPAALLSPSSAQKPNSQLTPSTMRKDVLSAAMKREQSTDSRLNTPPPMSQASPPVNGTSHPTNGMTKQQPSTKTPKQQAWELEQKRLETLGRELKHAATDHIKAAPDTSPADTTQSPTKEQTLAAIKTMESLLAYFLAFTVSDQAALAADPPMPSNPRPWKSLVGFYTFVKKHCEPFPLLFGLACWLGVVFNARSLELTAQNPAETSRDSVLDISGRMQRAAAEAEAKLDLDTLMSAFPKTWKGRSTDSLPTDELEVGKGYDGPYKLPLGLQTSPIKGARAGYKMLEEWIETKCGKEYVMKLKL